MANRTGQFRQLQLERICIYSGSRVAGYEAGESVLPAPSSIRLPCDFNKLKREKVVRFHVQQQVKVARQAKIRHSIAQEKLDRAHRKEELLKRFSDKKKASNRKQMLVHCSKIKGWEAPGERNVAKLRRARKRDARAAGLQEKRNAVELVLNNGLERGMGSEDTSQRQSASQIAEMKIQVREWTRQFRIIDHLSIGAVDARQLAQLFKRLRHQEAGNPTIDASSLVAAWDVQGNAKITLQDFLTHMQMGYLHKKAKPPKQLLTLSLGNSLELVMTKAVYSESATDLKCDADLASQSVTNRQVEMKAEQQECEHMLREERSSEQVTNIYKRVTGLHKT